MLYVSFIGPGLLVTRHRLAVSDSSMSILAVYLLVTLAFIVLEALEYRVWGYRYPHPAIPRALFVVRFLMVAAAIAAAGVITGRIRLSPELSSLVPLLALYAGLAFRPVTGVGILLGIMVVPLFVFPVGPPRPATIGPEVVGFAVFRLVLVGTFFLLAWFLKSDREQREQNARLMEELAESRETIRRYAEQIGATVALEERTRLARDIHDSIGHALTAITIQLTKAQRYRQLDPAEAATAISAAQETAREAMADVRRSIGGLSGEEPAFDVDGGIRRLARNLEASGIATTVTTDGDHGRYNYAVLIGLYRFVQEATTNVLKHADASAVTIECRFGDDKARIVVRDNGRGFDRSAVSAQAPAMEPTAMEPPATQPPATDGPERTGLRGLQHRLELVGGRMTVETQPGGGTILTAVAPRNPLDTIAGPRPAGEARQTGGEPS